MTKYFLETEDEKLPLRVEVNNIAYCDVTGSRINWDYDKEPDETFYKQISKKEYNEIVKTLRKRFLRWQMIKQMKEFEKVWNEINETWQEMDGEDWNLLAEEYPFYNSFDEIKIPAWVETVKNSFKE